MNLGLNRYFNFKVSLKLPAVHSGSVLAQALGCSSLTRAVQNQPERQNFVQNPQTIMGHQSK